MTDGISRVFFHATTVKFDHFNDQFKGSNTGAENTDLGYFFLESRQYADKFLADHCDGDGRIIEAELEMKKTISFIAQDFFTIPEQASALVEVIFGQNLEAKAALDFLNDEVDLCVWQEITDYLFTNEAREIYVRHGFDSAISRFGKIDELGDIPEYIVFNTEQITIVDDGLKISTSPSMNM